MRKLLKVLIESRIVISIIGLSIIIIGLSSFDQRKKIRKSKELDSFVKLYKYVPFNIPRDGDGVGTIVRFKRKAEAVIAAPNECFELSSLTIDTLKGTLPNYEYRLSKENDVEFNTGKIFGDNVNLSGAFKDGRVDSVMVKFTDVYEVRSTRISVERQLQTMDKLCKKRALQKKNYLIERVLGVGAIEVKFYNRNGKEIKIDLNLMDDMKIGYQLKKEFNGQYSLSFSEPRLIGYRLWDIDIEVGFAETSLVLDSLDIEKTLDLKFQ
jgi:hypothetical protein